MSIKETITAATEATIEFVKEHPVACGIGAAVVVGGVAYMGYRHFKKPKLGVKEILDNAVKNVTAAAPAESTDTTA